MLEQNGKAAMSVEEFADYVGIGRYTAYKAVRDGHVPFIRLGKRIVIPRAALDRWLENCGGKNTAA